jgi:hypothetical protein
MADFNIGGIFDALTNNTNQQVSNLQQGVEQQAYDTTQLQQLLTGNVEAARAAIGARTQLAVQKATIESHNAQLAERAQAIVGLNPDDLNNDFVKSVARYNSAEEQRKTAQSQLNEAASVGILDNPITWLFNQLQIPSLERTVAGVTADRDGAIKDIQARTAMLTQHKSSVVANVADTARQYNVDLAKMNAEEAFIKLREEEAKNLSAISSRKLNEVNLRDKMFNEKAEYYNKVLSLDELNQRRQDRALTYEAMVEERRAKLDGKQAQAAAAEQANLNLQRYAQFTGAQPITVEMLKLMPESDPQAKRLWRVATTGSIGADMKEVLLGLESDPAALASIQASNPLVAQTISKISDSLSSYIQTTSKPDSMGKRPSEKKAVDDAFTLYEDELKRSMNLPGFAKPLNSEHWDKQYNPYRADHKLMLHLVGEGNAKFLANNLVTKTAQSLQTTVPATAEGFKGEHETLILKTIAERVKNRELPVKAAAAQVVQYYNAAVQIGADQTQYGIFKMPLQTRYMVGFTGKDVLDRPIMGDLLNQASVENMLNNLARDGDGKLREMQLRTLGGGIPGGVLGVGLGAKLSDMLRPAKETE